MKHSPQAIQASKDRDTARDLILRSQPAFEMALGSKEMAEHFARVSLTLVNQNPQLANSDGMTLIGALMNAAQLKLYVGSAMGQAYIIPYRNHKRGIIEAQFQIGYQGYIDLFYRHQLASELYAEVVYENDTFDMSLGTDRKILHKVAEGDRGKPKGYYAVAKLSTGALNMVYMSIADAQNWRQRYSRAMNSPWDTSFDEMAKKTVIKKVLKYMPKSIEMMRILEADETVKRPVNISELAEVAILPDRMDWSQDAGDDESNTEGLVETPAPQPVKPAPKKAKPKPEPIQDIEDVEAIEMADAVEIELLINILNELGYSDKDTAASIAVRFPETGIKKDTPDWREVLLNGNHTRATIDGMSGHYAQVLSDLGKGGKK